jgi:hypothetical protein
VTPEEEALDRVVSALERHAIPYMLTGSLAASFYGRPRTTHDADIVIDPSPAQLAALTDELAASGFYVDHERARESLRERRQFNVVEMTHACKIDLIIRKDRPFSRAEFDRRRPARVRPDRVLSLVSPEDAILSKLEWAHRSGDSERQLRDAAGVLELVPDLDRDYIHRWAKALDVVGLWEQLLSEAR